VDERSRPSSGAIAVAAFLNFAVKFFATNAGASYTSPFGNFEQVPKKVSQ